MCEREAEKSDPPVGTGEPCRLLSGWTLVLEMPVLSRAQEPDGLFAWLLLSPDLVKKLTLTSNHLDPLSHDNDIVIVRSQT